MPAVVLTDAAILNRRIAYRCCVAMFDAKALRCEDHGDESCAALYRARATQMMLAHKVMMGTPTSTESASDLCYTHEEACTVIEKFDPFCVVCGCAPDAAPPAPPDCTITADYTVNTVIDSAQVAATEAANQTDGYAYYIVSIVGGSGASPGQMATYSTTLGGWQYNNPAPGSIILDSSTGIYWVDYAIPVLPAQLFPPINSTSDGAGQYVIQSAFPWQSAGSSNNVVVEMFDGGLAWAEVYSGPASTLATPITLTLAEPGYFQIRATYTVGPCTYQYYNGVITQLPNPPGSSRSWYLEGFQAAPSLDFVDCLNNQQATVSFRFKVTAGATVGLELFQGGNFDLFIMAGDGGPLYPGLGNTLYVYANNNGANGNFAYTAPASIFPNEEWLVLTIVRDSATPDGWLPNTDVKIYLGPTQVLLTPLLGHPNAPGSWGPSDPQMGPQQVIVYGEGDGGKWIDEIYGCRTARSASDVANIIVPNLMQGSDATWDRAFYWRIEDTDGDQLIANQPSGTPLIGVVTVLSTDVDPSI